MALVVPSWLEQAANLLPAAVAKAAPLKPSPEAEAAAIELPPLSPEDRDEALSKPTVTENDVAAVVSAWTKVPVEKVSADESVRLVHLEEHRSQQLVVARLGMATRAPQLVPSFGPGENGHSWISLTETL
eukprot:Skav204262  [mRNA]  locus=scaffold912:218088:218818:- [translate_table: standard]